MLGLPGGPLQASGGKTYIMMFSCLLFDKWPNQWLVNSQILGRIGSFKHSNTTRGLKVEGGRGLSFFISLGSKMYFRYLWSVVILGICHIFLLVHGMVNSADNVG